MGDASDDTVLIGVTTERAAKIVGVSVSRIAAWERIGLIVPEATQRIAGRLLRVFSLGNLVELSVAKALETEGVAIRTIRRVVEAHRNYASERPLRELRWAVSEKQVYIGFDDGSWVGGRYPMQGILLETIDVTQIRVTVARRAIERAGEDVGRVERRARTLGRKTVFAGTRIPVETVVSYMRDGAPDSEILEAYPHLTGDDLAVARQQLSSA
jgi:uncharacterized protein (DUF433 family)